MATLPIETDALVIGAGPVGLWQVFQLGLQEIRCHVVDALPHTGGQPAELYPDKPIYDIPGIPVCSGQELIARLQQQIHPFAPAFHAGHAIDTVQRQPDGRLLVSSRQGQAWLTHCLFIAAGVGAFTPRPLNLEGIAAFDGRQLHYHRPAEATVADQDVVVHGGEDEALRVAIALADAGQARRVTLLHRRDVFQADETLVLAMRERVAAGRLQLVIGQPVGIEQTGSRLTGLSLAMPDGSTQVLPLDQLMVFLGISPRLGPLSQWGLAMERKQLVVSTDTFQTSERGIYAVGDINTYPGKKKLILCGFHEATLAAFAAAAQLRPDERQMLQYTTTSPRLHQLLGVSPG
jgi:thioredoxin reductase (NADPH)